MRSVHDVVESGQARKAARRGRLSRKRVKQIAGVGQWWECLATEQAWRIAQLHRGDGGRHGSVAPMLAPVVLERPGQGRRYLTFGELASGFVPIEDEDEVEG